AKHISQLCLRWKRTACSLNEAFAAAISFMPNHAANALAAMNGTQMKPAFCNHSGADPAGPFTIVGSPPNQPNTPTVMTIGTMNCTTLTPRFPSPAFSASALPFSERGKKKEILAIEEAKLPPPRPHRSANARNTKYGVSGFCTAYPIPTAGSISDHVAAVVHRRPPNIGTMKE